MKRLLAWTVCLVLGLAGLTAAAQAQGTDLKDVIARGEIVVGVDMTTPPWGYLNGQQQPDGYGVALGGVLAESLKVKLKVNPVTGPTRIPALLDGRADVIISTLSITAPRAAQVWFTNPYSSNPLVLVGPKSLAITKYDDITGGMRIAVPRGSPQDQILTAKAPQATILRFDDDASANQALVSGQADLIGTGILVPPVLNQMNPGKDYEVKITLSVPYMAMAVRPGNINLLNYLNTFLFLQKQNGKLEEISEKYLKIPVGDLPLL
jgi:polar amino acid transport system substrate-binding protein